MNTVSVVIALLLAVAVIAAFVYARRHRDSCGGCGGCDVCSRNCDKRKR